MGQLFNGYIVTLLYCYIVTLLNGNIWKSKFALFNAILF